MAKSKDSRTTDMFDIPRPAGGLVSTGQGI